MMRRLDVHPRLIGFFRRDRSLVACMTTWPRSSCSDRVVQESMGFGIQAQVYADADRVACNQIVSSASLC